MEEVLKNKIKLEGDVAVLYNYQKSDDIQEFFKYCYESGIEKYALMDSFNTRYSFCADGNIRPIPGGAFDLVSNHIQEQTKEEKIEDDTFVDSVDSIECDPLPTKTYSEDEYNSLLKEKDDILSELNLANEKLEKYKIACEFFDKIEIVVGERFNEQMEELNIKLEEANKDKQSVIEKMNDYKIKIKEIFGE